MNTNDIGKEADSINAANGWETFETLDFPCDGSDHLNVPKLCTHMALVHSEVSEATEAIRNRDYTNFCEEMADVVIRVASICYGLGIDLDSEIVAKLEKNKGRGHKHGGKAV